MARISGMQQFFPVCHEIKGKDFILALSISLIKKTTENILCQERDKMLMFVSNIKQLLSNVWLRYLLNNLVNIVLFFFEPCSFCWFYRIYTKLFSKYFGTMHHSEVILYLKCTLESHLSPNINLLCSFFETEK